jgi:hypothetical protein
LKRKALLDIGVDVEGSSAQILVDTLEVSDDASILVLYIVNKQV